MKFSDYSLLFAYGTLERHYDPPMTLDMELPDSIRGDMYEIENLKAPGAVRIGNSNGTIYGQLELIHADELKKLDKRESPEYKRVPVTTDKGHEAWVYEYRKEIPEGSKKINKWKEPS